MNGARVAVLGFGNAGSIAAHLLHGSQCRVIAVSDSNGCIYNKGGLDIPKLMRRKERTGKVAGFPDSHATATHQLIALECEILIPAALENVILEENAFIVRAKIIAESANGPVTPEAV